eukprot:740268-Prymnesium_polylepis.1
MGGLPLVPHVRELVADDCDGHGHEGHPAQDPNRCDQLASRCCWHHVAVADGGEGDHHEPDCIAYVGKVLRRSVVESFDIVQCHAH